MMECTVLKNTLVHEEITENVCHLTCFAVKLLRDVLEQQNK